MTSLILQYKLQRGRYVRDHCKLQVLPQLDPLLLYSRTAASKQPQPRRAPAACTAVWLS